MITMQTPAPLNKKPTLALHDVESTAAKIDHFSPTASSVSVARQETLRFLVKQNLGDVIDQAEIIVSELITNAVTATREMNGYVRPGNRAIRLSLTLLGEYFFMSVMDRSPTVPSLRKIDPDSLNGRGLILVEAMCSDWGFYFLSSGGKVVWAQLHTN